MIYTPFIWPLLFAAVFLAWLALYTRRYYDVPGVQPLAILCWLGVWYVLVSILAISTIDPEQRIYWSQLYYVSTALAGPAFLGLAMEYSGRARWLNRYRLAALCLIPLITIGLALTSESHQLLNHSHEYIYNGSVLLVRAQRGVWYWVHFSYTFILIVVGCALVMVPRERISPVNRIAIVIGIALQTITEVLFTAGFSPVPGISLGPVMVVFMTLIISWALLRDELFGLTHTSRGKMMDSLDELVVMLDTQQRVVSYNRAAADALRLRPNTIGVLFYHLPTAWAALLSRYLEKDVHRQEVSLRVGGDLRIYELTTSNLRDRLRRRIGRLYVLQDVTERKQAEDALRQSQAVLLRAQRIAHMGNWTWQLDTDKLEWSDEMYHIFGLDKQDMNGAPFDAVLRTVHPDDRARVELFHTLVRNQGEARPQQFRVIWPDGSVHTIYSEAGEALRGEDGRVVQLSGIAQDITLRVQTENALRESENKFRSLFEQSLDGIDIVNRNEEFVDVNEAYCRIVGYSRDELLRMKLVDIVPPELRPASGPIVNRGAMTGTFESFNLHRDGRRIPVEITTTLLKGSDGLMVSVVRDISERKWAEQALRENEERYRSLVMHSPDAVLVYQNDSVSLANYTCARLFGADTPDALLGKPLQQLIHPDYHELLRDRLHQLRTRGSALPPVRMRITRLDAGIVDTELSAAPFAMDGAFAVHIILRDITERLKAEQALRESEAFNRAVLDNLPVGIAVNSVDPNVVFNYINDNFCRFYRTTREALAKPDGFWDAVYEDPLFRAEVRERVLADCASGDPERMVWEDVPITRKGEETTYINARNIPVPGRPLMISMVTDVTERHRAAERLRESEERYRNLLEMAPVAVVVLASGRIEYINPAGAALMGAASPEAMLGKAIEDFLVAEDMPATMERIRRMYAGEKVAYPLETRYRRLDGSIIDVEVKASLLMYNGLPAIQVIVVDITERKRAQSELLEYLNRERMVVELGRELASTLDLQEVYRITWQRLGEMIDCPNLAIELLDLVKNILTVAYMMTEGEQVDTGNLPPLPYLPDDPTNSRSRAIATQQPVIDNDLLAHVRAGQATLVGSGADPVCAIYIPMVAEGRVIGLLDLQHSRENAYSERDGVWLAGVANLIGLSIQQARLYAEAQRTAVAEERNRLAGELHDAVSQTLFSSNLAAESLLRVAETDPAKVRAGLVKLQQLNRGALAEMRTLLMELRPATLLNTRLRVLLEQLTSAVLGRIPVTMLTHLDDIPPLPPDVHIALYRVAQEALNNIIRHAEASKVDVTMRALESGVEIIIEDNGQGFDPSAVTPEHQGLQIMRERAERVGIALDISSVPGQGTRIRALWHGQFASEVV